MQSTTGRVDGSLAVYCATSSQQIPVILTRRKGEGKGEGDGREKEVTGGPMAETRRRMAYLGSYGAFVRCAAYATWGKLTSLAPYPWWGSARRFFTSLWICP